MNSQQPTNCRRNPRQIELRNVCVNNLQAIDLDIPHGQWLAICGLSGSGKSSLAFDTLYAEGQRRYLESLSPKTRQFIHQLDKPAAGRIDGIPPAVAVRAFRGKVGRKTTVGNATEVVEYLRLLFAKVARLRCPACGIEVQRNEPQSVAQHLSRLPPGTRFQVTFLANQSDGFLESLMRAKKNGFTRVAVGLPGAAHAMVELSRTDSDQLPSELTEAMEARVVVDRLTSDSESARVREAIEIAMQFGSGSCEVLVAASEEVNESTAIEPSATSSAPPSATLTIGNQSWARQSFSRELTCRQCSRVFAHPEPRLFSFNHPYGACEACDGLGELDAEQAAADEVEPSVNSSGKLVCARCQGSRLNSDAVCFHVAERTLPELCQAKINDVHRLIAGWKFNDREQEISRQILPQVRSRLKYLAQVGLGYLTLDRSLRTLSAGEAQRVSLTSCLSSSLVNMLYVLDEPSVGLHSHDVASLLGAMSDLHQRGNTVVVVDHDEEVIRAAERIVEIGPAAGVEGGEVVFDGDVAELVNEAQSVTGDFLAGRRGVAVSESRRPRRGGIRLTGARGHNLRIPEIEFPLGCLCVVTGVSGAGKSSLVQETLYRAIRLGKSKEDSKPVDKPLPFDDLFGEGRIDEVVLIDQSPIGRSPRSNPVTYVKAFDDIRRTFADTVDAKTHNVKVNQFSFNVAGGRCDKCDGAGQLAIDMQFMSDIFVTCDECRGTRYRDNVLAVKYRGKSIAEALNLTVREAFSFFRGQPKVQTKLKSLIDVGLDYIRLGQPATTLSSGEAQRLKLGHYLNASKSKQALFLLDEPTTGLHMADVTRLLDCFEALVSVGHSMIVVEHNLQLIKHADWVIDLGPGAAEDGGRVVAAGTPEEVASVPESITGQFLRRELDKAK